MSDAAIIKATFSTYRPVSGRKVLQLVMEVPIEAQGHVFAALGYPLPDETLWVAICRLNGDVAPIEQPVDQPDSPRPAKSLAQIAGIICNEPAFWKYVNVANADEAAEYVRGHCNVSSRAALDSNDDAASAFRTLKADYGLWLQGIDGRAA